MSYSCIITLEKDISILKILSHICLIISAEVIFMNLASSISITEGVIE